MHPSGWQIVHMQLSAKSLSAVKDYLNDVPESHFEKIFHSFNRVGDVNIPVMDEYRQQFEGFPVHDKLTRKKWFIELKKKLTIQLQLILSSLELKHWAVLYSKPGCSKQNDHIDIPELKFPAFAGIASFDDSTTLEILGEDSKDSEHVVIPEGHAIIFKGSLIHSGSAYSKSNKRLYFKACPSKMSFDMEDQDNHVGTVFTCNGSGCKSPPFASPNALTEHKRWCTAVHGEETIAHRRAVKAEANSNRRKRKLASLNQNDST